MKAKTQIDPARDRQLRRLAKAITTDVYPDETSVDPAALYLGDGGSEDECVEIILAHLRRAEVVTRRANPVRGMKVAPTDMALPVRAIQSCGVLWLVVDANDRNVSSLLTDKEAQDFAAWVNNQAIEITRLRAKIAAMKRKKA